MFLCNIDKKIFSSTGYIYDEKEEVSITHFKHL